VIPVDPLAVRCPHCGESAGERCGTATDYARKPHVARVKLARAVAADADPALDEWFPKRGPCLICGTPGLDQRHRVVDAIADYLASEPDAEDDIAAEYEVPAAVVRAVGEWARRWAA
jgi:hypothetical protein